MIFTIGGSNSQYDKDRQRMKTAGIEWRFLGSTERGKPKRYRVAVDDPDQIQKMIDMGFPKSRRQ
jgi:hypothetical protein